VTCAGRESQPKDRNTIRMCAVVVALSSPVDFLFLSHSFAFPGRGRFVPMNLFLWGFLMRGDALAGKVLHWGLGNLLSLNDARIWRVNVEKTGARTLLSCLAGEFFVCVHCAPRWNFFSAVKAGDNRCGIRVK
jgi:hypothetical protein